MREIKFRGKRVKIEDQMESKIAQRIYSDLKKGSNPRHERIENIIVEDN